MIRLIIALFISLLLAACSGGGGNGASSDSSGEGGAQYVLFAQAMTDMRDAGTDLAERGFDFQSQSMYAFSGASLSAMRYAVENILFLRGEGGSLDNLTGNGRYAGWDDIAALSYASPYPYYFEGLLSQIKGDNGRAKSCYKAALLNPAYPADGVDFLYLKDMGTSDLYKLRNDLLAREDAVYSLYTPNPSKIARDAYNFFPEYLRAKAKEALDNGNGAGALAFAKAAALNDSFDVLNYRSAALCAILAGELETAAEYINAGLIYAPEDEGLLTLKQGFITGGK